MVQRVWQQNGFLSIRRTFFNLQWNSVQHIYAWFSKVVFWRRKNSGKFERLCSICLENYWNFESKELIEWSKTTWSPDEMIWATAARQNEAPRLDHIVSSRLILWVRVIIIVVKRPFRSKLLKVHNEIMYPYQAWWQEWRLQRVLASLELCFWSRQLGMDHGTESNTALC